MGRIRGVLDTERVSYLTVFKQNKKALSVLVKKVMKDFSISEDEAVAHLGNVFREAKKGDFN